VQLFLNCSALKLLFTHLTHFCACILQVVTSAPLVQNLIRTGLDSLSDANVIEEARKSKMKLSVASANRLKNTLKGAGLGDFEGNFAKLESLLQQIKDKNERSVATSMWSGAGEFRRLLVAHGGTIRIVIKMGLDLLFIDGSWVKHDSIDGCMIILVGITGNLEILPIAMMLCESESAEAVEWMFEELSKDEGLRICFREKKAVGMDRGLGLIKGINNALPGAYRWHCFKHIERNLVHEFGQTVSFSHGGSLTVRRSESFLVDLCVIEQFSDLIFLQRVAAVKTLIWKIQNANTTVYFNRKMKELQLADAGIAQYLSDMTGVSQHLITCFVLTLSI